MGIKQFFDRLGGRFVSTCKRFWPTLIFSLALTVYSIVRIHIDGDIVSDTFQDVLLFYLIAACFLTLSLALWVEDGEKKRLKLLVSLASHLLMVAGFLFMAFQEDITGTYAIAIGSTIFLVIVSIFSLSFLNLKNEVPAWNFAIRLILGAIVASVVAGLLAGSIDLLLKSFDMLFGIEISYKAYSDVGVICTCFVAPLLFMLMVPPVEEKQDYKVIFSRFGNSIIHYIFIPLLIAYFAVLYVYALKIIYLWELPVGWVSYLVSALMFGSVLIIALLYPVQFSSEEKKIDRFLFRYIPIAVLPLLLLMSVAIGRRLSDYGITVSRLYLVVFNIWCYAVCIFLIIGKARKIFWLPVSFALALFFVSVGPQNLTDTTRRVLNKELKNMISNSGEEIFPLDSAKYEALLERLDTASAGKIDSKLDYLRVGFHGRTGIDAIVDSTVIVGKYINKKRYDYSYVSFRSKPELVDIPKGFSKLYPFSNADVEPVQGTDSLKVSVNITIDGEVVEKKDFFTTVALVRKYADGEGDKQNMRLESEDAYMYVEVFYLSTRFKEDFKYSDVDGFLLLK